MEVAFVSGPIAPPGTYFSDHYEEALREAIASDNSFVLGPAPGIDTHSLKFLVENGVSPDKITAYLAEFEDRTLRPRLKWFEDAGGHIRVEGVTTSDRDAAMTRDSNYDILRYMSIEEQKAHYGDNYYPRVSVTQKNERRRLGLPLHKHDLDDNGMSTSPLHGLVTAGSAQPNTLTVLRPTVGSGRIIRLFDRLRKIKAKPSDPKNELS